MGGGRIRIPCITQQAVFIHNALVIVFQLEEMFKAVGEQIWYLVHKEVAEEILELKTL